MTIVFILDVIVMIAFDGEIEMKMNPETLRNICLATCVKHPFEALIDNYPANRIERISSIEDSDDEDFYMDVDEEVQSTDFDSRNYMQLKDVFLPESLCEPLFQEIIRLYPEDYIQVFTDTYKCRLTKIDLSNSPCSMAQPWASIRDQKFLTKLFLHPLREINFSNCIVYLTTLRALRHCSKTLRVLDLSGADGVKDFSALAALPNLAKLNLRDTSIGFQRQYMSVLGGLNQLSWLDLSSTAVDGPGLVQLKTLSR